MQLYSIALLPDGSKHRHNRPLRKRPRQQVRLLRTLPVSMRPMFPTAIGRHRGEHTSEGSFSQPLSASFFPV